VEPKHKLSKRIHGSVLNIHRKYTDNFNTTPFHSSVRIPSSSISPSPSWSPAPVREAAKRKKRERKYCLTPLTLDPCWMKVEMTEVDGVDAHCWLLFGRRV